jgi:hypothetical protein
MWYHRVGEAKRRDPCMLELHQAYAYGTPAPGETWDSATSVPQDTATALAAAWTRRATQNAWHPSVRLVSNITRVVAVATDAALATPLLGAVVYDDIDGGCVSAIKVHAYRERHFELHKIAIAELGAIVFGVKKALLHKPDADRRLYLVYVPSADNVADEPSRLISDVTLPGSLSFAEMYDCHSSCALRSQARENARHMVGRRRPSRRRIGCPPARVAAVKTYKHNSRLPRL